jgi:serine/threonine protein kinase
MHGIARDTIVDGRYRAEKRLGSGGMAEVWCAEDDVLGRRVALKLLGSRFASDVDFRERFKREAQAAASRTRTSSGSSTAASGTGRRTSPWSWSRAGRSRTSCASGARCRPTSRSI